VKVLDFHNHFYPQGYLDAVKAGPTTMKYSEDDEGNPLLGYPGDTNVVVPGHRNIERRIEACDAAGVDHQILTLTTPATHIEEPNRAAELARIVNDEFADIANRFERFHALGTLPLNDPEASVLEFERLTTQLGLRGVMVFSNINGVALADERFWPLYERANDQGAVIMIHPTAPVGVEAMLDYWLMPLIGFTMDTTLAAAKLVFSGVAERFPRIRWVLGHLGGAIPYLAERLDRGFHAFEDCRKNIDRPPSEYLKKFYYDTVNFDPNALRLALEFAGVEHLVAGSDYPHKIGSLERMLSSIDSLDLTPEDRERILTGNARALMGI
jgi:aminocarboxymuconate-semialdehyde decarboxylase